MLWRHPLVDYIEPQMHYQLAGDPYETRRYLNSFLSSANQVTPWGISMVRAPEAWAVSRGAGARVLVIDTGINPHVDLPAVGNCGGLYGGCTDGPHYHGTHVAGTLLARDNAIGVVGVAPDVAGSDTFSWAACSPSSGLCRTTEVAAGIDAGRWAGVHVINMSLGGPSQNLGVANAVAAAWSTGEIVLVAAAGNLRHDQRGGGLIWPAAHSQVIGVSGVRDNYTFAFSSPCPDGFGGTWKSNHGTHVELSAPFWALSTVGTSSYEGAPPWCGTSMSTPHVSGAAALVRAKNPSWSNQQIRDQLTSTAYHPQGRSYDVYFGHGIVDAAAALGLARVVPLSVILSGDTWLEPGHQGQWFATASGGTSGDYTFRWFYNNQLRRTHTTSSNQDSYSDTAGPVAFTIRVEVDRGNETASAQLEVRIRDCQADPTIPCVVAGGEDLPARFELYGHHPNPLTTSTTLRFALPEAAEVRVVVVDLLGREVLRTGGLRLEAGFHQKVLDMGALPSGVYLYRFEALGENGLGLAETRTMTVVR